MTPTKQKKLPAFLTDASVLVKMFEGEKTATELLDKLYNIQQEFPETPNFAFTTISSILRAIHLTNPNKVKFVNVNKVLEVMQLIPNINYKNKEKYLNEIITIAELLTGGKKPKITKFGG